MRFAVSTLVAIALLFTLPARGGEGPWVQIAQLYGSDTDAQDSFGEAIALDGDTLVVGAFRKDGERGAAYIFERLPGAPTQWVETKRLEPPPGDIWMGVVVETSGDVVAVASSQGGDIAMTNIYHRDAGGEGEWGQVARFGFGDDGVGLNEIEDGIGLDGNPDFEVDGKQDAGAVHIFEQNPEDPGDWHYVTTLTASDARALDQFGHSVALSRDNLLVGVPNARDLGTDSGAAYVFERDESGAWTEVVKLLRPDGEEFDHFGAAIDLDVDTGLVGSDGDAGREAALVYERDPSGAWTLVQELRPDKHGSFGIAVGISGDVATVGSRGFDLPDMHTVGAAYVYERHHGGTDAWGEVEILLAAEPEQSDGLGEYLVLDGNTLAVSATQDNDRGTDAGTVYLFSRTEPLLSITGRCPGELAVSVIGTTPSGQVVLLGSESEGVTPIPSGPCAGTEVDLAAPKVVFNGIATSGGDLLLEPEVGLGTCGRLVQAVDVGSCRTTAVVEIR